MVETRVAAVVSSWPSPSPAQHLTCFRARYRAAPRPGRISSPPEQMCITGESARVFRNKVTGDFRGEVTGRFGRM